MNTNNIIYDCLDLSNILSYLQIVGLCIIKLVITIYMIQKITTKPVQVAQNRPFF